MFQKVFQAAYSSISRNHSYLWPLPRIVLTTFYKALVVLDSMLLQIRLALVISNLLLLWSEDKLPILCLSKSLPSVVDNQLQNRRHPRIVVRWDSNKTRQAPRSSRRIFRTFHRPRLPSKSLKIRVRKSAWVFRAVGGTKVPDQGWVKVFRGKFTKSRKQYAGT